MKKITFLSLKKSVLRLCALALLGAMLCSCGADPAVSDSAADSQSTAATDTDAPADSATQPDDGGDNSPAEAVKHLDKVVFANEKYTLTGEYGDDSVTLTLSGAGVDTADSVELYINPNGAAELVTDNAWRLAITPSSEKVAAYKYSSRKFTASATLKNTEVSCEDGKVELVIPYSSMSTTKDTCTLAILPSVTAGGIVHAYRDEHPYTSQKYAETWLVLEREGGFSCDCSFEQRTVKDWSKPKYTGQDAVLNAAIKENTVEEAIVAIAIAEAKGATGYTLRLETLADGNALTKDGLERIFRSTKHPVMALYYDGDQTQQKRLDDQKMAAECGAAAIDLPGFMYHTGSTAVTHTASNRKYWEDLGFDMCFIDASPAETPISPAAIQSQTEYIEEIHTLGCEVLLSTHGSTVYTAKQAVAYAEFVAARGVDIVKIVGKGQTAQDVAECVEACKAFGKNDKLANVKVSFHLSGASSAYITRVLCPTFYGSYIYFCYPELTTGQDANQLDLDMAAMAYKLKASNEISIDDAISALNNNVKHDQLTKLITNYRSAPEIVSYIYATKSLMDKKWTFSDDGTWTVKLREKGNSNSYTTRAHAYDPSADGGMTVSATITGSYQPYVSNTRQPRVGVFFGNDEQMLALTYNDSTKKIELCAMREGWKFRVSNADPEKKDALVSTSLYTSEALGLDIGEGDSITLGMSVEGSTLVLYAAKGGEAPAKIAELPYDQVSKYLPESDLHAGIASEIYMGSPSASNLNTVTFSNVSYDEIQ